MPGILIYPSSADVVGIFDANFNQQFPNARPMRASIRQNSRPMEHPLETGQIITDYRIILPIEVEIPFMVAPDFYRDTYQQILNLFTTTQILIVQTLPTIFQNMIIAEMPHEESPDYFNSIRFTLRFKQVQVVQSTSTFAPADPLNTNTQNVGVQAPGTIAGVATSTGIQTVPLENTVPNPLAASTSGAVTNPVGINAFTNPDLPNNNFTLSGVATVGGAPAVDASFQ
jgi:hypothetical protein